MNALDIRGVDDILLGKRSEAKAGLGVAEDTIGLVHRKPKVLG
jgi:hypothetical protein